MLKDIRFMKKALKYAEKSNQIGEVPIGAIIVKDDKIIATGYNKKENTQMATNHAEIIAINKACRKLKSWRLDDSTLYVSLEPCVMCAGAILSSRIKRVVFGAYDKNFGSSKVYDIYKNNTNHTVEVEGGVLEKECSEIITTFFKKRREK